MPFLFMPRQRAGILLQTLKIITRYSSRERVMLVLLFISVPTSSKENLSGARKLVFARQVGAMLV